MKHNEFVLLCRICACGRPVVIGHECICSYKFETHYTIAVSQDHWRKSYQELVMELGVSLDSDSPVYLSSTLSGLYQSARLYDGSKGIPWKLYETSES